MHSLISSPTFKTILMLVMAMVVGFVAPSAIARSGASMDVQMIDTEDMEFATSMRSFVGMNSAYCNENQSQNTTPDMDCVLNCSSLCVASVFVPSFVVQVTPPQNQIHFTAQVVGKMTYQIGLATPPPRI